MKFASRAVVGLVAALLFSIAIADEAGPSIAEARYVIARADGADLSAPLPIAESALDAYVGRYDAGDVALIVDREGDSLTIELTQPIGASPVRLHVAEAHRSFTADDSVHVVFENDAGGRVLGLRLYAPDSEVIAAAKAPLRVGIVTIHDLSEDAASSRLALESLVRSF
jgi:hypothetical protein